MSEIAENIIVALYTTFVIWWLFSWWQRHFGSKK